MSAKRHLALRIAPFEVDITPPAGHPLAYGVNVKTDSPIHVRGLVLDDGRTRAVLAAAEIIGLYGGAYPQWKRLVARAAGVPERRVLLHCVHQHDSLRPPSPQVQALVNKRMGGSRQEDEFWRRILLKLDAGVRAAVKPGKKGNWLKVTGVATAERRLIGLGANRRLLNEKGKVQAMRWSMTSDRKLQRFPAGRIDPLLRTIGWTGSGGRVLASAHFYASHPMGAYQRNRVSADIPGVALGHLRAAIQNRGTHMYFTGCAGDVTFGKYTSASKAKNLRVLGRRLGEALTANVRALEPCAPGPLALAHVRLEVPLNRKRYNARALTARLKKATTRQDALSAARGLELLRRWNRGAAGWGRPTLTRLSLGPDVHLLSLPAETAVAYQLYAQSLVPEQFLAVAAYGDGTYQYICTAEMFREGGYEPSASVSTPAIEGRYTDAIARLLRPLR